MKPPIDVAGLIRKYANLEFARIPGGVDAICLNLKKIGTKPTVILQMGNIDRRRRFTLAHELGHIVIPWHIGDIVDEIADTYAYGSEEYEANRFAAELLMPNDWLEPLISNFTNPIKLLDEVSTTANVSKFATILRLMEAMPPGHVLAEVDSQKRVILSALSPDSFVKRPQQGEIIDPKRLYKLAINVWEDVLESHHFVWWQLPACVPLKNQTATGDWKELLEEIFKDLKVSDSEWKRLWQSFNGVVASANSRGITAEQRHARILLRLNERARDEIFYQNVITHAKFDDFLSLRILALGAEK